MTSVERIKEYADINQEIANMNDVQSADWPQNGEITLNDVSFRYHESLPYVLHNINCHIKSGEKVSFI